jgi:hypothetical protein
VSGDGECEEVGFGRTAVFIMIGKRFDSWVKRILILLVKRGKGEVSFPPWD